MKDDGGDAPGCSPASGEPDPIGLTATPGMPWDQFRWYGRHLRGGPRRLLRRCARAEDMDLDGVDAEVLFPPQRTIGHFLGDEDDDFVLAGVEAYNNFPVRGVLRARPPTPHRHGPDPVARHRHRGRRPAQGQGAGFKGVVISNWPPAARASPTTTTRSGPRPSTRACRSRIHINLFSRSSAGRQRAAAKKPAASGSTAAARARKAKAKAVAGLSSVFSIRARHHSQLIFTGVFERFPDLHIAMIETGVGWIPHFLEQIDDRYWRNRSWGDLPISEPPSSYWYRNMSATFITDRNGITSRHEVGVDNIMWSTDYPHHGNDWPYSRKVIDDTMADIPADERGKILAGNAVRIFNLEDRS